MTGVLLLDSVDHVLTALLVPSRAQKPLTESNMEIISPHDLFKWVYVSMFKNSGV